jgi:large subunit ribosomal protein L15
MQKNNLKRHTPRKKAIAIGRGGKRGKTSGRGTKGQHAHGGHGIRPDMRDTIKKIPKLRGRGKNINTSRQVSARVINITRIDAAFENGAVISP